MKMEMKEVNSPRRPYKQNEDFCLYLNCYRKTQRRVKLGQAEVAVLNQIYILENHSGYSVETSQEIVTASPKRTPYLIMIVDGKDNVKQPSKTYIRGKNRQELVLHEKQK